MLVLSGSTTSIPLAASSTPSALGIENRSSTVFLGFVASLAFLISLALKRGVSSEGSTALAYSGGFHSSTLGAAFSFILDIKFIASSDIVPAGSVAPISFSFSPRDFIALPVNNPLSLLAAKSCTRGFPSGPVTTLATAIGSPLLSL